MPLCRIHGVVFQRLSEFAVKLESLPSGMAFFEGFYDGVVFHLGVKILSVEPSRGRAVMTFERDSDRSPREMPATLR